MIQSKKFGKILALAFLFAAGFSASAGTRRGKQDLVLCGSWVYDSLTAIAMECGTVNLSDRAPLTINEILLYVEELDRDSLSEAGKAHYDAVMHYVNEELPAAELGEISFSADPVFSAEGQYKSNDSLEWIFDRYERSPFLSAPVRIEALDVFSMYMDVVLRQNRGIRLHNDNYTNIPLEASDMDINFPDDAYVSTGIALGKQTFVNFRAGINSQSIGRTSMGSLIWSEYLTGASSASLCIYNPDFRWTMNVTEFNVDKYMYSHGFDLRLFKKLSLSAMESVYVNAPFELRYMNPFTVYHGMSAWKDYDPDNAATHVSSYFSLKFNFVPCRFLRFYGLWAMDQFQTSYEIKHWPDDVTPNAMAWQLGAESYIPLDDGYLHAWLEGYYAEPYMYIKESPNWTFVRTYRENIGDMAVFYEWVGSPLGPDTVAGELNLGYESRKKWSVTATYLFMARGEYSGTKIFENISWGGDKTDFDYTGETDADGDGHPDDLAEWAYPDKKGQGHDEAKRRQSFKTPHGTPEYVNRISLRAEYRLNDAVTFRAQPGYVFVFNNDNKSGRFEQGFEFAFTTTLRIKGLISK